MKIKLKWKYAQGEFDTKTMKLIAHNARPNKGEKDAELAIQPNPNSTNFSFAEIHLGDVESSNKLAEEICRRFNEFPEDQKL